MTYRVTASKFFADYGIAIKPLADMLSHCGIELSPSGPWLAGGSLRRLASGMSLDSDLDFFFSSPEQLNRTAEVLKEKGFKVGASSDFNVTYHGLHKNKAQAVQLIRLSWFESPEQVIDSFDFTICQVAYDGTDLILGDFALWDIARKRLSLHRLTYGASTVRRLLKYGSQGYTACQGTFSSILKAVAEDPTKIREEVEYVD